MPLSVIETFREADINDKRETIKVLLREAGLFTSNYEVVYISQQHAKGQGWRLMFSSGIIISLGKSMSEVEKFINGKEFRDKMKSMYRHIAWYDGNPFIGENNE